MKSVKLPIACSLSVCLSLLFAFAGCTRTEDAADGPGFNVDELQFSSGSGMRFFDVLADGAWEIDVPEWIECEPMSGEGDATVMALVEMNPDYDRQGEIVLSSGGMTASLAVVQEDVKGVPRPNKAPSMPVPLFPAEGDVDVPVSVSFRWKASVDEDGDPVEYHLEVSSDGGDTWKATVTAGTEVIANGFLEKEQDFLWRVRAIDGFGGDVVSGAVAFRTGDHGGWLDGEAFELQHESVDTPEPVHLVFTGDGFVSADWKEDGKFMQDVQKAVEAIFAVEPYKSYREYFRIIAVAAHSEERGATVQNDMGYLGPKAQRRKTVFGSTLEGGGSTFVDGDDDKVWEYARRVPGIEAGDRKNTSVFVLVNVDAYAGTCHAYSSGFSASFCPLGTMNVNGYPAYSAIIVHEGAGHGFGCLQDEYRYYDGYIDENSIYTYNVFVKSNPLSSWNVSLTGEPEEVHWKHYFDRPGYEAVEMYEGAMQYARGVWRPELVSCMEDNRPYFNAPSREAIVRRIFHIAGLEFDLDDFIAKDVVREDPTGVSLSTRAPEMAFPPLAPPVYLVDDCGLTERLFTLLFLWHITMKGMYGLPQARVERPCMQSMLCRKV